MALDYGTNAKCNTLGVCHQLNNEFELKHGKLGGDEYVKAESINRSPT